MFYFIKSFSENLSNMSENKTVLTVAALLLAATGICIYQVNSGKNLGHHSQVKRESTGEKVFKSFV